MSSYSNDYSDSESIEKRKNPINSFSWRWINLDMDNWTDAEINEFIENYVYFKNKVVNALNEKFRIPLTWDYLPEEDEFSEESEDSWDEEYQDEAWTNYGQFKDMY